MAGKGKMITAQDILDNILLQMETHCFCKRTAARIVGGPKKLEDFIAQGKIRAVKIGNKQKSKWKCNAADVLRHCRCMSP